MIGWCFVADDSRDRPHAGQIEECATHRECDGHTGLGAADGALMALHRGRGSVACIVRLSGEGRAEFDPAFGANWVYATERTYLRVIDARDVLDRFAHRRALDVAHLWNAPPLVRRYLETGDDRLRKEARRLAGHALWRSGIRTSVLGLAAEATLDAMGSRNALGRAWRADVAAREAEANKIAETGTHADQERHFKESYRERERVFEAMLFDAMGVDQERWNQWVKHNGGE